LSAATYVDEEANYEATQQVIYSQEARDRNALLSYRDHRYLHCEICNYNNYPHCEAPCRNSLITPNACPKALIVYLPRRDYRFEYILEVIFEDGPARNRFYEILRKRNVASRPSPNDYQTILPSEALNLGYKFVSEGRHLNENNFILRIPPNSRVYIAPRLNKEVKICRAFRDRMYHNGLYL
jgi:hypothetical protein